MIKIIKLGKHTLIYQRGFRWVLNEELWFWTDEWQEREREAEEDLKAGRYTEYETFEDFLKSLDEVK